MKTIVPGWIEKFFEKKAPKNLQNPKYVLPLQPHLAKCTWKYNFPKEKGGNSSVGRAQPCQGWGRGSESRFPLTYILNKSSCNIIRCFCPGGGIGRRARFRCVCREACRFESCSGHSDYSELFNDGEVAELVDALLGGGSGNCDVGVRVSSSSHYLFSS